MKIKKLAGGGLPAYASYTAVQLPLPSNTTGDASSSQSSSSESSSSNKGDIGLLSKEMVKILMEKGLPNDVLQFLSKIDIFGNSMDPYNPTSSATTYKLILSILPEITANKEYYDKAIEKARDKGTLDEIAVTGDGYVFINIDGKATKKHISQISKEDLLMTNGMLALLRAYSKDNAFDKGSLTDVIFSSTNIEDITKYINEVCKNIGKDEITLDSFVRKGEKSQLQEGLQSILKAGEDGVYKVTTTKSTQLNKANKLLKYVLQSLPKNQRAFLLATAIQNGLDKETGATLLIADIIIGKLDDESKMSVSFDNLATKGATDANGKSDKYLEQTPLMDYFGGLNGLELNISINPGKAHQLTVSGMTFNTPVDTDGNTMGMSSFDYFLSKSGLGSITDSSNGVYVGNLFIDSAHFDRLIYSGGALQRAYLPATLDKNGNIKPNLDIIQQFELAKKDLAGIKSAAEIKRYLLNHHLEQYFTYDNNGLHVNTATTKPFFMVNVYGDGDTSWFNDHAGVFDPDDTTYITRVDALGIKLDDLAKRISKVLGKDAHYSVDGDLYSGVAFIPILGTNLLAAQSSGSHSQSFIPKKMTDQMLLERNNEFKHTSKSVLNNG